MAGALSRVPLSASVATAPSFCEGQVSLGVCAHTGSRRSNRKVGHLWELIAICGRSVRKAL